MHISNILLTLNLKFAKGLSIRQQGKLRVYPAKENKNFNFEDDTTNPNEANKQELQACIDYIWTLY